MPTPPIEPPVSTADVIVGSVAPLKAPIKLPEVPVKEEITVGLAISPAEYP